jgi:hypothetical protein
MGRAIFVEIILMVGAWLVVSDHILITLFGMVYMGLGGVPAD